MGDVEFRKLRFLAEFQTMRERIFTEATICTAWKKTGLILFNPEVVLGKIRETQNTHSSSPTTPPSTSIPNTILDCTPYSSKKIVDQGKVLQRRILAGKKVNPKYLSRFIKESIASAHSCQIMEDGLKSVQRHATAKAARKKLT